MDGGRTGIPGRVIGTGPWNIRIECCKVVELQRSRKQKNRWRFPLKTPRQRTTIPHPAVLAYEHAVRSVIHSQEAGRGALTNEGVCA